MPAPSDEAKILAHVMRERRLMAWAFVATGFILSALILNAWYMTEKLANTQAERCAERNHVAETIIKYLPENVNKQAVIDEADLPLDCKVYNR